MHNIEAKQIISELCDIYGNLSISMYTLFRWVKFLKMKFILLKLMSALVSLKPLCPRQTWLL